MAKKKPAEEQPCEIPSTDCKPPDDDDITWLNAQFMESKTTSDNTMAIRLEVEAQDDMACAFMAILGRDKAAVRLGIKVLPKN